MGYTQLWRQQPGMQSVTHLAASFLRFCFRCRNPVKNSLKQQKTIRIRPAETWRCAVSHSHALTGDLWGQRPPQCLYVSEDAFARGLLVQLSRHALPDRQEHPLQHICATCLRVAELRNAQAELLFCVQPHRKCDGYDVSLCVTNFLKSFLTFWRSGFRSAAFRLSSARCVPAARRTVIRAHR